MAECGEEKEVKQYTGTYEHISVIDRHGPHREFRIRLWEEIQIDP